MPYSHGSTGSCAVNRRRADPGRRIGERDFHPARAQRTRKVYSVILAENTLVETLVDDIDRLGFDNWNEHSARRTLGLIGLFAAGSMYALHRYGRRSRFLCNEPVLLFDDGARWSIAIEATKDFARDPTVRPLRAILINHVKKREFRTRCRFPRHCHLLPVI
jgi:hypothetical protein